MTAQVDQIAKGLEAATAAYHQGLDALKTPDDRAVYSPEEERRRRNELTAAYQEAQRTAQDALQAAITDAEREIVAAMPRDPLDRLTSTEMETAGRLRAFLSDDFQHLPLAELVAICQDALESNDRARKAVVLRAGRHAMASRFPGPGEGYELKNALAQLEEAFADKAKRSAAQATLDAAGPVQRQMHLDRYLRQAYGHDTRRRVA